MTTMGLMRSWSLVVAAATLGVAPVDAALTADQAAALAVKNSSSVVSAQSAVLTARAGNLRAMGGLLPSLTASYSRRETRIENQDGFEFVAGVPQPIQNDSKNTQKAPSLSTSWGVLNTSAWAERSAASKGMRAARFRLDAARNDIALAARRQFYEVVKAIRLADVSEGALRLSRDDERRVKAMFEVGSVSKSDLLKAQVRTSQSELALLQARHLITTQRIGLAQLVGLEESKLGDVDTVLAAETRTYDEPAILAEAEKSRPDLMAAKAELASARASHSAARLARLPFVNLNGSATFKSKSESSVNQDPTLALETDRVLSASVALVWNVFDLGLLDAGVASAKASLIRAQDTYDVAHRDLAGEVREALLAYQEAVESNVAAQRGLESATENLKLTQEKYNVGSATILELIDAQVQLETAQSDRVKALAAIHVAEAQINRVRGQSQ